MELSLEQVEAILHYGNSAKNLRDSKVKYAERDSRNLLDNALYLIRLDRSKDIKPYYSPQYSVVPAVKATENFTTSLNEDSPLFDMSGCEQLSEKELFECDLDTVFKFVSENLKRIRAQST